VRRGFGEEAKRLALEVRDELGLKYDAPLDPRLLANLYGIPIYPLGELTAYGCQSDSVSRFAVARQATFSAALVPVGTARLIIENPCHAETRRMASLAHEMAHVLLEHEFGETILTLDGCRSVPKEIEAETDRLGGELLIPYKAALRAARSGLNDEIVAYLYQVSQEYAAMRMNASGARKVAAREKAYRRAATVKS
jgi:hypothetical protein